MHTTQDTPAEVKAGNIAEAAIGAFLRGKLAAYRAKAGYSVYVTIDDEGIVRLNAFPGTALVSGEGKTVEAAIADLERKTINVPRIAELRAELRRLEGYAS